VFFSFSLHFCDEYGSFSPHFLQYQRQMEAVFLFVGVRNMILAPRQFFPQNYAPPPRKRRTIRYTTTQKKAVPKDSLNRIKI